MNTPVGLVKSMSSPAVRKLQLHADLAREEIAAYQAVLSHELVLGPGENLVREGDRPGYATVMLAGLACRYKTLEGGTRQILSFLLPGDVCDLQSYLVEPLDHSIGAITRCVVARVPHQALTALVARHPNLGRAFWRETLIDAAVQREWMVGLGRRSAFGHLAHLLCEVLVRMRAVGLTDGLEYELPLTQADLADALGLSLVHVNRVLQHLRGTGLIAYRNRSVSILDWDGLRRVGQFDEAYLHLGAAAEPPQRLHQPRPG
jgi:CRP-like cAMP-binding protein